ncbi:MAG: tRNA(Ile)-lysidine synthase, partial [Actinomycetota bacterium]|nr:tRNA(Ile)-lysidine synthase [Actinomycetota bacterium]
CEEVDVTFYDDPANEDDRFERTAVRTKVVPVIEERWGDGGVRSIANSLERLTEDVDALGAQARTLYQGIAAADENGVYTLELDTFVALPRALRRRLLELAVGRVRDRSGGISEALDALERPARKPGARFALAEGGEIMIGKDRIVVSPPKARPPESD